MKTWQEFVEENGITEIVESLDMGPTSPPPYDDESLSLRINYLHPKYGPCTHELYFYVGTWADELWEAEDPHTAMWEAARGSVASDILITSQAEAAT